MTAIKEYAQICNDLSDKNEYTQVPLIKHEWKVLRDSTEINTYLPAQNHITLTTGITNKKINLLNNFESIDIRQSITNKRGHILNTGASIWALEFVPKPASLHRNHTQYLAVGGYNSIHEHYTFEKSPCVPNTIQIWKCTSDISVRAKPRLDMCLLHDFGVVVDFKWCPYSVYNAKDKLGIVAVLFSTGEIKVLVVPHPQLIRNQENIPADETVYLKVETARLDLKLPRINNLCLAWGGYRKLACGTKSGNIVVWNILNSLLTKTPTVIVNIPDASLLSIRSITWSSLVDEDIIYSSDSDGNVLLFDLSDPFLPCKIFRVRCTYICVAGTGHSAQFIFGDIDGTTRTNVTFKNKFSVVLTMHNALVWSIATSPHHGIAATSASNGTVRVKLYANEEYILKPKHKVSTLKHIMARI
ncbi:WD40-repeat-containing domain protein [Thamnidium elegans]|nr:WD40-repeat-containing domain protein [Thamnidium elegans]